MNRRAGRGTWCGPLVMLLLVAVTAGPALAATRYDPRLRFRTIVTARFDIHFHQGEEPAARRLARLAEEVAASLDATLGRPAARVQVVLVNQDDLPNGWATPVPFNLIEIGAAGPRGESLVGNSDDWLRLVFTHEYTHIVHLERAGGWIGGLRRVLGRNPALFPNMTLPLWSIEGIATFEESAETGLGRVPAGDFRQIVSRAAAAGQFEPLDRAGGGLDDWPAGDAPYAYGALFHRYLADRFGRESLRRLTDEAGRRLPYLGARAFRTVFGASLGRLWSDFEADIQGQAPASALAATRITNHGFAVAGPRFHADGRLFYSIANPDGFPSLMVLEPGSGPRRVTSRYLGDRVAPVGPLVVFDQMDVPSNVGLQRDLYAFEPAVNRQTRLTRGMRAGDPDLSPDGRKLAFTIQRDDRRDLMVAPLRRDSDPSLGPASALVSAPDTELASPQWSPDGRWIAAERRVPGVLPEIVLVDVATGSITVVSTFASSRCVSPSWMPDGRRLLFASSRGDDPFRVFAVDIQTGGTERLEGTGPSAQSPHVSPDGRTIVYVGYTPGGYDLFTMPLDTAEWSQADPEPASPVAPGGPSPGTAAAPYTPWRTIAPRFWTPTLEIDSGETVVGAGTAGGDALGRHVYAANVQWAASRTRPDWRVSYAYDRWRPTLFLTAADDADPFRSGEVRSTEVNTGVLLPWRRVRWAQSILGAFHASTDTVQCGACEPAADGRITRRSLRAGYTYSSARSYGYSVSREEGWSLAATQETVGRAFGSEGNAGALAGDLRAYRRALLPHGVIAGRVAAARSWGDESVRRSFSLGGVSAKPGGFFFGSDAIGLLRGYDDELRGWHAVVVNLDYRFPLARIQRGAGTLPIFVRSLHGALFVDGGHAWDRRSRARDARLAFGAELSLDTVLGHVLPVTVTSGASWRRDGLGVQPGVAIFGRVGRAF